MIVRERENEFILIDQHHHASLSGKLFDSLKDTYTKDLPFKKEIRYAIFQHDCGWIPFDETPFWNDRKNIPFSFTSFPTAPKTVLYEHGINMVEEKSKYAALLCSKHYELFMEPHTEEIAHQFVEGEKARRKRIEKEITGFDETSFLNHYEILQFFDNLSLYICLNEPGTRKEEEHPFFKKGIPLPNSFDGGTVQLYWENREVIKLDKNLFKSEVNVSLTEKVIRKANIKINGIQKAFDAASASELQVRLRH